MAEVNVTHDIVLNNIGFKTVPKSVHVARMTPFTQRISTGKPTHSDLDNWDVISSNDWTHGLGQEGGGDKELDPQMYYEADGVETSEPGEITLATRVVLSDNGFAAHVFCDGGNKYVFAGGDTKIRYFDPATGVWADAKTGLATGVWCLVEYKGVVYATLGDAQNMWKCADPANAPTTWVEMTDGGGVKRTWMTIWKDKLWASNGNSVYSYDGATWSAAKVCGDSSVLITSLAPSANYLIVGKEDRVMLYDDITDKVYETGLVVPRYVWNFRLAQLWNGMYWYPQLGTVQMAGGLGSAISVTNKTPEFWGSNVRRTYGYGNPLHLTQNVNRLFVMFDKAENSYPVVLKHNGLGWHPVYRGAAGATAYGLYYSEVSDRLWINDGSSRYQRYLSTGKPYPDYWPWWEKESFITFSIDSAGFDEIPKAYRSLAVVADNLSNVAHPPVGNPGYEIAGTGGVDVFADWVEIPGSGSIADETGSVHSGAHAAKLTKGAPDETYLETLSLSVVTDHYYWLAMWTRGDGTNAGRYFVWDSEHANFLVPPTSTTITGATYAQIIQEFLVPAGCTHVILGFMPPTAVGGVAYFDDIELLHRSAGLQFRFQRNKDNTWTNVAAYCDVSPQQEINFSGAAAAVSSKLMQINVVFRTDTVQRTPRLKVVTLKRIVRSPTLYVVTAELEIADHIKLLDNSGEDSHTAQELIAALMAASDTVEPITLDTPDGWRHSGALTNLSFHEKLKREES